MRFILVLLTALGISIAANAYLGFKCTRTLASLQNMQQAYSDLQRAFDAYVDTEKAARELKAKVEQEYGEEKQKAADAVKGAQDWADIVLPSDVLGVLHGKDATDSLSSSGSTAQ